MRQIESWECPNAAGLDAIKDVDCSTSTLAVGDLCEGDNEVNQACAHNFNAADNCGDGYDVFVVQAPAPSPPPLPPPTPPPSPPPPSPPPSPPPPSPPPSPPPPPQPPAPPPGSAFQIGTAGQTCTDCCADAGLHCHDATLYQWYQGVESNADFTTWYNIARGVYGDGGPALTCTTEQQKQFAYSPAYNPTTETCYHSQNGRAANTATCAGAAAGYARDRRRRNPSVPGEGKDVR